MTMLNEKTIAAFRECSRGSADGTTTFPQVLEKLIAVGAESYHADLYRHEKTYYMPGGESHVEDEPEFRALKVAEAFNRDGVRRAIQLVQQGKTSYIAFMERIAAAGVAHYWVYVAGKRAIYAGRGGDIWTEWFPLA